MNFIVNGATPSFHSHVSKNLLERVLVSSGSVLDCVQDFHRNCDLENLEATGPRSFQGDAVHKNISHVGDRLQIRFILP